MKRVAHVLPALAVALAACADAEAPTELQTLKAAAAGHGPGGAATYEVTVTNLTSTQPLTPPLAVAHRPALRLFRPGAPASHELQQIAENGNLDPMVALVAGHRHVADFAVAVAGDPPPLMPGASVTFTIEAARGAQRLSFVSMLICTNDGFTGLDAIHLPRRIGGTSTTEAGSWDAGTEINTEDFADLVPPCPVLTGVPSMDPGTGMTDPGLAENGVVRPHPGIAGDGDLDPGIHGWTDPVARVEVTRVG